MNELAEHDLTEIASLLHQHWITGEPLPPHKCKTLADRIVEVIGRDLEADEPDVACVLHLVSLAPPLAVVVRP